MLVELFPDAKKVGIVYCSAEPNSAYQAKLFEAALDKDGEMAYDILVNGADVSAMEIAYAPQVTKEYNAELCEALNVTVPEDYVAISAE